VQNSGKRNKPLFFDEKGALGLTKKGFSVRVSTRRGAAL
jgi:hypothetical protein